MGDVSCVLMHAHGEVRRCCAGIRMLSPGVSLMCGGRHTMSLASDHGGILVVWCAESQGVWVKECDCKGTSSVVGGAGLSAS